MGLEPYGHTATTIQNDKFRARKQQALPTQTASVYDVMKKKAFWQLSIPYFICGFTDVVLIQTHLIPFGQEKGFSVSIVALTFSTIALLNIIGTIGTGYLSEHFHRSRQPCY